MFLRTVAFLSILEAALAGKPVELPDAAIPATSKLGSRILSSSRKLDNNDDFTWVAGYSIQFVKCATSDEYYGGMYGGEENDNQNGYGGMYKQRLVHYKLCPTGYCDTCDNGADYVIDMNLFVEAYIESKLDAQEYNCEQVKENCYYDDEYQCYAQAGLDYCMDNDQDNQNGQGQQFALQEAVECRELEVDDEALQYYYYQNQGDNNGQYYNQNGNNNNNNGQQEMQLFVGPYCADNGKSIHLGTFMDEMCSYPAPSGTYEQFNYGQALPYSAEKAESLIDDDCVSCKEPAEANDNNNGDNDDEDEVLEICERIYEDAGKCESGLADGVKWYPNTYACDFIQTLKAPGKGGVSMNVSASKVFAGLFAATTLVFAGVSYYLYQKARRSNVNLASSGDGTLA